MVPNVLLSCTHNLRPGAFEVNKNIYLIGPMGSGKTTVGQRLAKKLNLEFYDCDHEIEERTGVSINLIFDIEGEDGFRKREHRMLSELTAREGVLIATGGGVVTSEANRTLLRRTGIVIYLKATVSQQMERLRLDKSRPLLQTEDREKKLEELAEARNPWYEELADLRFPARNRNVENTVNQILLELEERKQDSATLHG